MYIWVWILYSSIFLVFYNYAGYAILVYLVNKLGKKRPPGSPIRDSDLPAVSFIVAAYNEESCIREKVINSLAQTYPPEKIEFIFVTDGSTDNSPAVVSQYPSVKLLHETQRRGKTAAMNRAVTAAKGDVVIFSDANALLNDLATKNIARHYLDSRVGGVSGEKKVLAASASNEVGEGEGLYWKYESFLKKLDSEFYSVVGAAGELFSVRRELYKPVEESVILDDFIISLRVGEKGYRVIYEPDACASELPSLSIKDESKRKIRIAAGGFQSIVMLRTLLLFWKQPRLSFLYISHRVLRWTLTPLCLMLAFVSNLALILPGEEGQPAPSLSFQALFIIQVIFYGMAVVAKLFPFGIGRHRLFKLPYYFVFMNVSVVQGFFRFLSRTQSSVWEKARREASPAG